LASELCASLKETIFVQHLQVVLVSRANGYPGPLKLPTGAWRATA
jgi:hypothetical protein